MPHEESFPETSRIATATGDAAPHVMSRADRQLRFVHVQVGQPGFGSTRDLSHGAGLRTLLLRPADELRRRRAVPGLAQPRHRLDPRKRGIDMRRPVCPRTPLAVIRLSLVTEKSTGIRGWSRRAWNTVMESQRMLFSPRRRLAGAVIRIQVRLRQEDVCDGDYLFQLVGTRH